jgi:amino acid adenylation domain-containing protein
MTAPISPAADDPRMPSVRRVGPTNAFVEFPVSEIEQPISARFEQQVRRYPQHIAVKTTTRELTYEALNRAANRVAHALLARRGEVQEPIALLLPHDGQMVAAILGVLKAGKIHVPLDATFPPVRIVTMLEDSGAKLIVTNGELLARARVLAGDSRALLNVDEIDSASPTENFPLAIPPESFAYILYTSGSTGEPKGVVENHRNVLRNVRNFTNSYHVSVDDRVALSGSYGFSGTVTPLYGSLLNGATLLPLNSEDLSGGNLPERLARERVTIIIGVAILRALAEAPRVARQLSHLRWLQHGATALHSRTVELLRRHLAPSCVIVNNLSMTKMKGVCQYVIGGEKTLDSGLVPVGYPFDDVEILLVDEQGDPVGPGDIGEIAVKSRYLAPGYWRKPALTAATFLPDPHDRELRTYRTGDLGRRLEDGSLLVLGRKDSQVKVRGYRVELGEIEAALLDLDVVREAAVLGREDSAGDVRLIAYLVSRSSLPIVEQVRGSLSGRLPEYMVPSTFVLLDALPRNAAGKVDRRSLPPPDLQRPILSQPFVAPRAPIEQTVATIWAELLGVDRVGAHDGFLELGGDSLRATRIVSRVCDTFRVQIPLHVLLESTTVAQMTAAIVERRATDIHDGDLDDLLRTLESAVHDEAASPTPGRTP